MNQINNPDDITYKDARQSLKYAAPIVFIINIIAAVVMFIASQFIFNQETLFLGGLLAGAFVLTGVISFFILNAMGNRVSRTEIKHPEKHED